MSALIFYLLGILTGTASQNRKVGSSHLESSHHEKRAPLKKPMPVEVHLPDTAERERHAYQDKQRLLQRQLVIATWCTFVAVSIYALITFAVWLATKRAADAAKESADAALDAAKLNRQIFSGSNAASIAVTINPVVLADLKQLHYTGIGLNAINQGLLPAKSFHIEAAMIRHRLPGFLPLGSPTTAENNKEQIRPWREYVTNPPPGVVSPQTNTRLDTNAITDRDLALIQQSGEAIEVKGFFQYSDGLENTVREKFCYLYSRLHNPAGNYNEGWFGCDEVKALLHAGLGH